jgi:hypothetical protein
VGAGLLTAAVPANAGGGPSPADAAQPNDALTAARLTAAGGSTSLKSDSNEVAIEGFWLGSNDALVTP